MMKMIRSTRWLAPASALWILWSVVLVPDVPSWPWVVFALAIVHLVLISIPCSHPPGTWVETVYAGHGRLVVMGRCTRCGHVEKHVEKLANAGEIGPSA